MNEWVLVLHPLVFTDIDDIADYIGRSNERAAIRFTDAVVEASDKLLFMPQAHQPHPYYRRWFADLRHVTIDGFEKYGVFYLANQSDRIVHVIAVVHGSRHLRKLLRSRRGQK